MAANPPTIAQLARTRGFEANLAIRGRVVTTDTNVRLAVLVEDQAVLADPEQSAKAKLPVYTLVNSLSGVVANPRAITTFTELDGRWHKVLEYRETRADAVKWTWFCEAQRA